MTSQRRVTPRRYAEGHPGKATEECGTIYRSDETDDGESVAR